MPSLSAITINFFGESKPRVDMFASKGDCAFWREISRGRENSGPGSRRAHAGGLHELFTCDYEVAGPKLKRIYDFSQFFRQSEGPGGERGVRALATRKLSA